MRACFPRGEHIFSFRPSPFSLISEFPCRHIPLITGSKFMFFEDRRHLPYLLAFDVHAFFRGLFGWQHRSKQDESQTLSRASSVPS